MAEKMFYTKKEAAEVFGVHPRTVERWLMTGKLKGARFNKAWKISEEDIQALYDEVKRETAKRIKDNTISNRNKDKR